MSQTSFTSGYVVRIVSRKGLRQRFRVQVLSANGDKLLTSEKYLNLGYARVFAQDIADRLGAGEVRENIA